MVAGSYRLRNGLLQCELMPVRTFWLPFWASDIEWQFERRRWHLLAYVFTFSICERVTEKPFINSVQKTVVAALSETEEKSSFASGLATSR